MARQPSAIAPKDRVTMLIERSVRDAMKVIAAANKMPFSDYVNLVLERDITAWEKSGFRFEKTRLKKSRAG